MIEGLQEGVELGDFRILGRVGQGGMGVVYLAEQHSLGRQVALKLIAPALAEAPLFRERFQAEARHAAALDHPNVVPIFEAGTIDEHLYLAMRYVDGIDLTDRLRSQGKISPPEACQITEQLAAALDAAHAKGLVHRDVKPANILLDRDGPAAHVYLTDFGLTKETGGASLTNTGQVVGTVDYMAPEQIERRTMDARTDVYSLACVLYQMLSGRLPFEGSDPQKMWAHMHHDVASLGDVDPELGRRFDSVIGRGMAKDPEDRFPSAGDLARAATAATEGQPVTEPERSVARGAAALSLTDPAVTPLPARRATREPSGAKTAVLKKRSGWTPLKVTGAVVALLAVIAAGATAVIFATKSDQGTTVASSTPTTTASTTSTTPTKEAAALATISAVPTRYPYFAPTDPNPDYLYRANIPAGHGWSRPVESEPTPGRRHRVEVNGPDGYFLLIDRTPRDTPELGVDYDSSTVIRQPAFGTATAYTLTGSNETRVECHSQPCVDYLIDDGAGGGWGVLAGGPDLNLDTKIGRTVTKSITTGFE